MQKINLFLICILPIILAAGPQEQNCALPLEKYYSVDRANGHCGECCMNPKYFGIFKIFESNLTKATSNTPCADNNYPTYDSTVTHGVWPISMTLDLYNPKQQVQGIQQQKKIAVPAVTIDEPQEQNCALPLEKYYSVDRANGHCGECCLSPKYFGIFKIFESNLTKATTNTPCADNNYPKYNSTVTHGVWPIQITLDLYDPQQSVQVQAQTINKINTQISLNVSATTGPQEKTCTLPKEKYYSVDTPHGHCGECCMNPKYYGIFKFFESNLTKATTSSPCADNNYPIYDSTETHGFGPISMTLDLYNPKKQVATY